ncbi:hypothetical protein ACQP0C_41865 (plasmid) [Nocardia sp. CA-129566]|uniref:hypothetical protein n=1 Tax=Nocardia sp. CA-129566 TaxID=3239976 RepID=UPI003D99D358
MVNVGDKVLLVVGGVSVFEVLEMDGDRAVVESVEKNAPGCFPFSTEVAILVPADPT